MYTKQTLEALNALTARFEQLIQKHKPSISEAQQERIANKFARKTLVELTDIVGQMSSSKISDYKEK